MALKDEVLKVYQEEKERVNGNFFVLYTGQVRQRVIEKREAAASGWFQRLFLGRPSLRQVRNAVHEARLDHPRLVRSGERTPHKRHRAPDLRVVSPV